MENAFSWEAIKQVFDGDYGRKMTGLFTNLSAATRVLHWDDMLMCVGDVTCVGHEVLNLDVLEFQPGLGFQEGDHDLPVIVQATNILDEHFSLHVGCRVVCAGEGNFDECTNQIRFNREVLITHYPDFEKDMAWDFTHLFAGAFSGWEQATAFLRASGNGFALGKQVVVDNDELVMQTWAFKKARPYHRGPLKMKVWDVASEIGILTDVKDLSLMRAISTQFNSAFTMSPPCVSWSRGGRGQGLSCRNGWAFIEALRTAVFCQACWIFAECADELQRHRHFPYIKKLMELAGYTLVWNQVMPFHHMSDSYRTRWLAVWSRNDVATQRLDSCLKLQVEVKDPWSSPCYAFRLPQSMKDQLCLSQSEFGIYSNKDMLPQAKKARFSNSTCPKEVISSRLANTEQPLPTLCASYMSQHLLAEHHLHERGIFATLIKDHEHFAFIDPCTWAALLGAHSLIVFPKKLTLAMHQLGNAIATPHAVMTILVGFKSAVDPAIDIEAIVRQCWEQRLTAHNSILCEGQEFASLMSFRQFFSTIGGRHPVIDGSCAQIDVCFSIPSQLRAFHTCVPSHWSLLQVYIEVMQIDPFAAKLVTCGNGYTKADRHTTLQTLQEIDIDWKLYIKGADFAFLALGRSAQAEIVPPTMPYEVGTGAKVTKQTVRIEMPSNDEILDSQMFLRVIRILENFYASVPTQIDQTTKQMFFLGLSEEKFTTKIPLHQRDYKEQIVVIAGKLCPDNDNPIVSSPPVLFETRPHNPVFLVQSKPAPESLVDIFVEQFGANGIVNVARVPNFLAADADICFLGFKHEIKLHNSARVDKNSVMKMHTADILTLEVTGREIKAGGHHTSMSPPTLSSGASFGERCEFMKRTHGWIAADEFLFACRWLENQNDDFATIPAITEWNATTNEILEIGFGNIEIRQDQLTLLPILVGAHWTAAEIIHREDRAKVTFVGLPPHLQPMLIRAIANLIDLTPAKIQSTTAVLPLCDHMCGWLILDRWLKAFRVEVPHARLDAAPREARDIIGAVIADSVTTWEQYGAPHVLFTVAQHLRMHFLAHIAQQALTSPFRTGETLTTRARGRDPPGPDIILDQTEIPRQPDLISQRLLGFADKPAWMASDEADFLLDLPRFTQSFTYYPPPARWDQEAQTLHIFNDHTVEVKAYQRIQWLFLFKNHWILADFAQDRNNLSIVFTGPDEPRDVYGAIARSMQAKLGFAHLQPRHTLFVTIEPEGLCGWTLLHRIFNEALLGLPPSVPLQLKSMLLSDYAIEVNDIRASATQHWGEASLDRALTDFCNTGRTMFLHRVLQGRLVSEYSQGGAPDEARVPPAGIPPGQPAQASTTVAQTSPVDPIFINDPWSRRQTKPQSTRWEDLSIDADHPFTCGGVALQQVHRLQLNTQRAGLVLITKQHLAELSKIKPSGTLAFLLPSADKSTFGDAESHIRGPYEIVLTDEALRTSYKRLVVMFVAKGTVDYSLPAPACKCDPADYVELVLELDCRLLPHGEFDHAKQEPVSTFKRILQAIQPNLTDMSLYGLRHHRHFSAAKDEMQLQIVCRVPRGHRVPLLEASGQHAVLVRDFVDKSQEVSDNTILPRFWQVTLRDLHELRISVQKIPGAAGLVLTKRGLALRVWANCIAEARRAFMNGDARITDENIGTVPRMQFESSGWPSSLEVSSIVKAVKTATGQAPIPTRAYRVAGVYSWSLSFENRPSVLKFTIEVATAKHEILLVETQNKFNPKASQRSGKPAKQAKSSHEPLGSERTPNAIHVVAPSSAESARLDALESKVSDLEKRQNRFEQKFDSRLDTVDNALRQLLQRSEPARPRETSGDTPPPKFSKSG